MAGKKKWNKTYAQISAELSIPVPTLQGYDKAGVDLNDYEAIKKHREIQSTNKGNPNLKVKRMVKPVDFKSKVTGDDLKANISKLRETATIQHEQWSTSLKDGNAAISSFLLDDYLKTMKVFAEIEKAAPNVSALNNESTLNTEVVKSVNESFFTMRKQLDDLAPRLAELVVGKSAIEVSAIVTKEVNDIIDDLYANAFLKANVA